MAVTTGSMTLVESSRPPRPTSITANSTRARQKTSNARAVGIAEPRQQRADVVQPELDAELFEAVEVSERLHLSLRHGERVARGRRLRRRGGAHEAQRLRDGRLHLASIDDEIDHAFLEKEFAALES